MEQDVKDDPDLGGLPVSYREKSRQGTLLFVNKLVEMSQEKATHV